MYTNNENYLHFPGLASFDSILLLTSIFLFVVPSICSYTDVGEFYFRHVHPLITPYTYLLGTTAQTSSGKLSNRNIQFRNLKNSKSFPKFTWRWRWRLNVTSLFVTPCEPALGAHVSAADWLSSSLVFAPFATIYLVSSKLNAVSMLTANWKNLGSWYVTRS